MVHSFSNPDEYKQHSSLQYDFAHIMLNHADIKASDRVLDIGCGDGKITADIAKMVPSGLVIGTDISSAMIDASLKEHVPHLNKNLGFMTMRAERNIFQKQFEKVTSFCCLHWVHEQLEALIGIKNALVTHGQAILLVPLRHEQLYSSIEIIVSIPQWQKYFIRFQNPHNFFIIEEYKKLLDEAELEPHIMRETIMSYEFNSKREMELFLKAWLPHMKQLPAELHDSFLSTIVNTFIKIFSPIENKIILPLKMLQVHATVP